MTASITTYPDTSSARTRWILARRGPKNPLDPWKAHGVFWEDEMGPDGRVLPTATILLTNKECPYRCLMCDLWQNTVDDRVPSGAIPTQIRRALADNPAPSRSAEANESSRQIKLYNAGSFFDPQAIPTADYADIACAVDGFERVIVECHPALFGERCLRFRDLLQGRLEVAIGLETVHPEVLARLNKRFTVNDFRRAAAFLTAHDISLRVFLLLRPPFMSEDQGVQWAKRSIETSFDCGATACCVIPTRGGNGAMEALAQVSNYARPSLRSLEAVQEWGIGFGRGRVFADIWDIERFYTCECSSSRAQRLAEMNRTQQCPPAVLCEECTVEEFAGE
jgi:radical SAM enzyme (TIGR01210 family)